MILFSLHHSVKFHFTEYFFSILIHSNILDTILSVSISEGALPRNNKMRNCLVFYSYQQIGLYLKKNTYKFNIDFMVVSYQGVLNSQTSYIENIFQGKRAVWNHLCEINNVSDSLTCPRNFCLNWEINYCVSEQSFLLIMTGDTCVFVLFFCAIFWIIASLIESVSIYFLKFNILKITCLQYYLSLSKLFNLFNNRSLIILML